MKHLEMCLVPKVLGVMLGTLILAASAGCATVRPEQRAILADPTMQFDEKTADRAALEHALDNREGSTGGGSVRGGGCGCN
ncbi:MAG TPA: DUF4266 domain-containing protein [Polyangiaceae bacterium]|nr:DUF4266 domain-containing protein [Polyangiaceae bacterium]